MKKLILGTLIIFNTASFSGEHALGAHVHGVIKLEMAVEKNIIDVDIDGPAESFIGFEHAPKNAKEKKQLSDAKILWEKNIFELIGFDKKLNCKITESSFNQVMEEGSHSDIEAKAKITCKGNLAGSEVQIALKKQFKNIKKLNVELLSNETKTIEITKPVQSFKI